VRLKLQIFFYDGIEVPTTEIIVMTVTGTRSDGILITGLNFAFFYSVFPLFQEVVSRQDRVSCNHSRAGVAHNFPNAFPHRRFITMYVALRANSLFRSERTFVDLHEGILHQFVTTLTQPTARHCMTAIAIYSYHGRQSLFFPIQTTMFPCHILCFRFRLFLVLSLEPSLRVKT
jgi:hypothetical protein